MFISTRKHPRGPLGPWETFFFNFSGTQLQFSCLPSSTGYDLKASDKNNFHYNLYHPGTLTRRNKHRTEEPVFIYFFSRRSEFDGIPFWDRYPIGSLDMEMSVTHLPEFSNLFRPRRWQCAIERFIYASFESRQISGISRSNWKLNKSNGLVWVNYEFENNAGFYNAESAATEVWQIPISDEHLLTLQFIKIYKVKKSGLAAVYRETIAKIMASLTLDYCSDAKASQAEAAQYPWEQLPSELPPYEFEEFRLLDRYQLLEQASLSKNHDTSIPFKIYDKIAQQEDRKQKAKAKVVQDRVLASHLRFENLEAEDKRVYQEGGLKSHRT